MLRFPFCMLTSYMEEKETLGMKKIFRVQI